MRIKQALHSSCAHLETFFLLSNESIKFTGMFEQCYSLLDQVV